MKKPTSHQQSSKHSHCPLYSKIIERKSTDIIQIIEHIHKIGVYSFIEVDQRFCAMVAPIIHYRSDCIRNE